MRVVASAVALVVVTPLAACGDDSTSSETDAVTTSDVASTEPATTGASATSSSTTTIAASTTAGTEAPPATTVPPPEAAPCTTEAILPVVAGLFPENEAWNIVGVDIHDCQNGYARVFALPDQTFCDPEYPHCLEEEQVFLVDAGGSWDYLDSGTGVDCNNPVTLLPETVAACEALGLR